ncbi:sensor histidine kinase YesM [Flavobacterium arsenatis]|uniref:Sensor histidine kinase YesM n=1 Tax=Flavobacterium arsenatis TaxID=1484332 RepID=A0ABU1TNJ3_9FLAO|nr:histidine kinase [Flavobacterium arsenatis]MDR6967428.1 sensor histidine kinase YesM [Flavobacterium arsenatis]
MKLFSRQKEIIVHVIYWLIFIFGYFIKLQPEKKFVFGFDEVTLFSISYLFITISTFYLNYLYILKKFIDIKMLSKFLIGMILIFTYFIALRYLLEEVLFLHLFGTGNYFEGTTIQYYIFDNLHWASIPIIASTIMWIVINFIRTLQKEVVLNEEKKKAEIQFLKSQINPHFIFNTLNNIYSMVFIKSEKALPAIEKLSEIMRFTTYETQKELIPIGSEIKYIESFIDLERIRNIKQIHIQLLTEIENENQMLPPYLLLPFIENCIKHGILDDENNPVVFSIESDEKKLIIEVENKINNKLKDAHSGIGLSNLRKRLEHYFPNQHKLEIINDGVIFKSHLEIEL